MPGESDVHTDFEIPDDYVLDAIQEESSAENLASGADADDRFVTGDSDFCTLRCNGDLSGYLDDVLSLSCCICIEIGLVRDCDNSSTRSSCRSTVET